MAWDGRAAVPALVLVSAAVCAPASAHPHVFITSQSEILFGADQRMAGVRQTWTFDEFYSAMAVQGLDTDGDGKFDRAELSELAKLNVESLKEFDYFTYVKESEDEFLPLSEPIDYWLEYGDGKLTLRFTLPLQQPRDVRAKPVTLDVYDPSFYIAFSFATERPIALSRAPDGCKATVEKIASDSDATRLSEAFISQLGAGSTLGAQFAQTVTVSCAAS